MKRRSVMSVMHVALFIYVWRHFGRDGISALRRFCKTNKLRLPETVVREVIDKGSDPLKDLVSKYRSQIEVKIPPLSRLGSELCRLENLYGDKIRFGQQSYAGFWHSKAGKHSADAQVVAVAKNLKAMAVSDDRAEKLACALENVPCIGFAEFSRVLGLVKARTDSFL